jgi:hypothetical protein
LIRSKDRFPKFKKFQIKYGCEALEIRNNFPYWNFSKFGVEFELHSGEFLSIWIQQKFDEFDETFRIAAIWTMRSWLKLDDKWTHEKEFGIPNFGIS